MGMWTNQRPTSKPKTKNVPDTAERACVMRARVRSWCRGAGPLITFVSRKPLRATIDDGGSAAILAARPVPSCRNGAVAARGDAATFNIAKGLAAWHRPCIALIGHARHARAFWGSTGVFD